MGRNRDHPDDARRFGARDDIRLLRREIREVEMAMGVDEHSSVFRLPDFSGRRFAGAPAARGV
jgi:hypothetical protein